MRATKALAVALLVALLGIVATALPAQAHSKSIFGIDCLDAPAPDMPGSGLAAFFDKAPSSLPKAADPFAKGSHTTMYEQYGYAGLRWHTYDLGCGPDVTRNPDAVIGTAVANWILTVPLAFSALTSSVTRAALHPTFMDVFDPVIGRISSSLHDSLFASWIPAMIALLGIWLVWSARRSALSTAASSVGWALMVVLVATAVFRWPLVAGHFADDSVSQTLGSVVSAMDGSATRVDAGIAIGSNIQESIFYKSWLAGTLGSTDGATAQKYGPRLFKDQALTWRESMLIQKDPNGAGKQLIEAKQDDWKNAAGEIKASDPSAYEYLTGKRSDTRFGYAVLAFLAAFLALPFLLVSALLLLGSFLVVRLAVMLFPAFATIGLFPATRGVVLGIGRTVGAALINAVIFGIGAAVTIRVIGLILDPASQLPGWLSLVLLPLFSFVMWVGLRPFRRLTAMVPRNADPFGQGAGAIGAGARNARRGLVSFGAKAAAAYVGGAAAVATVDALEEKNEDIPERAEARPTADRSHAPGEGQPLVLMPAHRGAPHTDQREPPDGPGDQPPTGRHRLYEPGVESAAEPLPPTEPEWVDGEEIYPIYHPNQPSDDEEPAGDAA